MKNIKYEKLKQIMDNFLKNCPKNILSAENPDGRINSTKNEEQILKKLKELDKEKIIARPKTRAWYDFSFKTSQETVYVNIKVSDFAGKYDNISSKEGFYYAVTGKYPEKINTFSSFFAELKKNWNSGESKDNDYYFFVVCKSNIKNSFVCGLKMITKALKPNGNNMPFQANWKKAKNSLEENYNSLEKHKLLLYCFAESTRLRAEAYEELKK